jgi:hypothetical protein
VHCVGFYTISYTKSKLTFGVDTHGQLSKKPHPVLDSTYRIGAGLDTSFNSNLCDLILLHKFLWGLLDATSHV